jgi:ribonuclease HII
MRFLIGIDEAGRGPLAGPVAVGIVKVPDGFDKKFFLGIKDSKKLTEKERELWFDLAVEARRRGELDYAVSLVSEKVIDKKGIVHAINLGIKRCLESVGAEETSQVFLDGGIKAPDKFLHQSTVVKGDEKIPVISLASILAKVVRDRKMRKFAEKYPEFGFDAHKGYGTKLHREAILKYGPTELHRKTFIHRLTK